MAATEPIRSKQELKELAEYYLRQGKIRNYTLIIVGVYTEHLELAICFV